MKFETSKKLLLITGAIFIVSLIAGYFLYFMGFCNDAYDTTFLVSALSITGSIYGLAVAFYYNKAKYENLIKLKLETHKQVLELNEKYGNLQECNDASDVIEIIDDKINSSIGEAIDDDCKIEPMG